MSASEVREECRSQVQLYGLELAERRIVLTGECTNLSQVQWLPPSSEHQLYLGAQILSSSGTVVKEARLVFPPEGVLPGGSSPFLFDISLSEMPEGEYLVSIGILVESQYWFHQYGGGQATAEFHSREKRFVSAEDREGREARARPKLIAFLLSDNPLAKRLLEDSLSECSAVDKLVVCARGDEIARCNEVLEALEGRDLLLGYAGLSPLDASWLETLTAILYASEDAAAIGGVIVSPQGRVIDAGGEMTLSGFPHYWGCAPADNRLNGEDPVELGFVSHRVALLSNRAIAQVGTFSNAYRSFHFSFIEWSYRAIACGFRSWVAPSAQVSLNEPCILRQFDAKGDQRSDRLLLLGRLASAGVVINGF